MPTALRCIGHSGLFDIAFYLSRNPDLRDLGSGALSHYHHSGWREGRKPNPFFDPTWYLETYRDVTGDPLYHYITRGDYEGRRPVPWFDPRWYRQFNRVPANGLALAHYLANRQRPETRPMPEFDPQFYLRTYADVAASGMDPVEHYMVQGFREIRRPFAGFDPVFYRQRYLRHDPDANPFLHWLAHRHDPGVYPSLPDHETTIAREIRRRTQPGPFFEDHQPLPCAALRRARVLAYYLPQYHAIRENDAWWGKGFTEWTNLARGVPRFADHYQPRIPRDLGHYRLDTIAPLREQARMARESGIEGFVFYHYWFDGKRLLERPVELLLDTPDLELPFCLMWANESWSRRWDGSENDVLIAQNHHEAQDEALIADFVRHMKDRRYITVADRPLLMIYRPGAIPEARRRIARWRSLFRQAGFDPILVMAQAFGDHDPAEYGLDGAIEFPPHKLTESCTPIEDRVEILDDDLTARIYDYSELVEKALADETTPYPRIRTAVPSWDNDPRRQGAGLVVHGSTPRLYEQWLSGLVAQARANRFFGEALICINAWNEWAEGAYLEPDIHFGAAYLNATSRAVSGFQSTLSTRRLLLVGHDAFPAGAQMLLLALARALQRNHGVEISFVLLGGGDLLPEYRKLGTVEILSPGMPSAMERLAGLRREGIRSAIVNSAASTRLAPDLAEAKIPFLLLVHELPGMVRSRQLESSLQRATHLAHEVFVPGGLLARCHPQATILPQGLYAEIAFDESDRRKTRQALGIAPDAVVVVGVGFGDTRKGFDLFLHLFGMMLSPAFLFGAVNRRCETLHFLWVGDLDPSLEKTLTDDLERALRTRRFHLTRRVNNVAPYLSAADLFLLTSREDPYPSVVMEALSSGLPCCVFSENGMIPELLEQLRKEGDDRHECVPPGDLPAMGGVVLDHLRKPRPDLRKRKGTGRKLKTRFSFDAYAARLMISAFPTHPTVSVVVLSFNYARYLAARLATVFAQDCPVLEILVLDDGSDDGSPELAERYAREFDRRIVLVRNAKRSGCVFAQWQKALDLAKGEWIWIAEADDLSEPDFLSSLLDVTRQSARIVMAFCDSRAIDRDGVELMPSYQEYYRSHVRHLMARDMLIDGQSFVRDYLSVANLVLNVSAAIFRRVALRDAVRSCAQELRTFRLAGDWRLYLELLLRPDAQLAFLAKPRNIHRRHSDSVTGSMDRTDHLEEITRLHREIDRRLGYPEGLSQRQRIAREDLAERFGISPAIPALPCPALPPPNAINQL